MTLVNKVANKKERTRFFKFATVGVMGATVDFGIANLLIKFLNFPLIIAGTISFICAVTNNFLWHRYWTFPESRSRHVLHQISMFILVNLGGITIRTPILRFVEPIMLNYFNKSSIRLMSPEFLARNFTLAFAIGIVMLWNYFVNRYWTYNDVD